MDPDEYQVMLAAFFDEMQKIAYTPAAPPPMTGPTGASLAGTPPSRFVDPVKRGVQAANSMANTAVSQVGQANVGAYKDTGRSFLNAGAGLLGPAGMAGARGLGSFIQRMIPTTRVGDVLSGQGPR